MWIFTKTTNTTKQQLKYQFIGWLGDFLLARKSTGRSAVLRNMILFLVPVLTMLLLFVGTSFMVPWYHITEGSGKPGKYSLHKYILSSDYTFFHVIKF